MVVKTAFLSDVIKNTDRGELLNILNQAKVSIGHWNGRKIQVEGYSGQITFSEIAAQIEKHYQAAVQPMQLRQINYEKKSVSSFNPMFMSGKGTIFINLIFLPFTAPIKVAADLASWATTSYPEISEEEEKKIAPVLEWRKQVDLRLNSMFERSQDEINSRFGRLARKWDAFLDGQSSWRNGHLRDEKILQNMVETRKKKAELLPKMKSREAIYKEAVRTIDDFLVQSKFR